MRDFLINLIKILWPEPTVERPSPKIRIKPEQVFIKDNQLTVTSLPNCFIAAIAPTNSEEPYLDEGMFVVLDNGLPHTDLIEGDVVWYDTGSYSAIHRIIKIGLDPDWYCVCKGDNNSRDDGIRVRPWAIKGVLRGIII